MNRGRSLTRQAVRTLCVFVLLVLMVQPVQRVWADVAAFGEGIWPEDWPAALEPLRESARSIDFGTGTQEIVYEIPFDSREAFEAAWPSILSVKDKGAPIVLVSKPSEREVLFEVEAGVRIVGPCPPHNAEPWPDHLYDEDGCLPEYATRRFPVSRWKRTADDEKINGFKFRVRTEIHLVVDGEIVDLNRIKFPADTLIEDRRRLDDTAEPEATP